MFQRVIKSLLGAYGVDVGCGLIDRLGAYCKQRKVVVVTDERVAALYGAHVSQVLQQSDRVVYDWIVPLGEESKSLWQAECLYDFLLSKNIDRAAILIALGGGVIGDLTGFVASTWKRGLAWLNCPTTLLAMADASIGGKTGLNHAGLKNCIGTFHPPVGVVADIRLLDTLEPRELSNGLAESVKHGLIADAAFLDWQSQNAEAILERDSQVVEELVLRNIDIKAALVERDELDVLGGREKLNFGHTLGHAFESLSQYQFSHGQAVALGMMAAFHMARLRGMVDSGAVEVVARRLQQFDLPVRLDEPPPLNSVSATLSADKKTVDERVRFVLPTRLGAVSTGHFVSDDEIQSALDRLSQ